MFLRRLIPEQCGPLCNWALYGESKQTNRQGVERQTGKHTHTHTHRHRRTRTNVQTMLPGTCVSIMNRSRCNSVFLFPRGSNDKLTPAIFESSPHCSSPKTVPRLWATLLLKSPSCHQGPTKDDEGLAITWFIEIYPLETILRFDLVVLLFTFPVEIAVLTFQSFKMFCLSWWSSWTWDGHTCSINILTALRRCHMHLKRDKQNPYMIKITRLN